MRAALAILIAVAAALPVEAARLSDVKRAKAYVAEVAKHLTESFIDRDKVDKAALERAGLKGLEAAPDHKDFAGLEAETRAALRDALKGKESAAAALDAAAGVIGEEKFDWLKLADHATRAMVKHVNDPFARILTKEEFNKLLKMLQGGQKEDSIGIAVQPAEKGFAVAYVQYGYVAYDEGIEMGDEISAINGAAVAGKSPEDVNEQLKLKPGESIALTVRRPGHKDAYEFKLVQRKTRSQDVHHAMLGDGVGYLRMTMFDLNLQSAVKKALKAMKEKGMTSIILDVRHNPGGALPASTSVADLFLPQNLLITKVEMSYKPQMFGFEIPGMGGDQEYRTKSKSEFEEMPMRVLINHASASASELLSGALQDHKRAKLIGETTYGKGVGQSPILLSSAGGGLMAPERCLYLTVLRYYLPTGRSINHRGVAPDMEFAAKKAAPEKFAAAWKVRTSKQLAEWLDANWAGHKEALAGLAEYDRYETAGYPGFDALFASLKTTLTKDEVRGEVRRAVRARLKAEDGTNWVHDLQTDVQLQCALVDILDSRK